MASRESSLIFSLERGLGIALQEKQEKKALTSRGRGLLRGFLELRRPWGFARDGVSREVPCSALKGETVPDSTGDSGVQTRDPCLHLRALLGPGESQENIPRDDGHNKGQKWYGPNRSRRY